MTLQSRYNILKSLGERGIPSTTCQAHRVIHQPISVVSQCVAGACLKGLASGDQHQL